MVKLRERLDTIEAIMEAIEGYQHLPIDVLSQFLLDHYTVDLDILAEFAEAAEIGSATRLQNTDTPIITSSRDAQSAA